MALDTQPPPPPRLSFGRWVAIGWAVLLIRVYQRTLSPLLGGACRFTPSCSRYAETALRRFGLWRGGWLAARRLARCQPWGGAGYDPVPERRGGAASRPADEGRSGV